MTPNPIRRVLSTIRAHRVEALLMGGQACVLYGAAEFSRDTDLAILAASDNIRRLDEALAALAAEPVAVPPLALDYLRRGHAIHFRCRDPEADGMRVDVMSVMRGLPAFPLLWDRRTTLELPGGEAYDVLALPDLVQAKKTQRDKDWPMVRRLVEADYFRFRQAPTPAQATFWLRELRTPALLIEAAASHPGRAGELMAERPLLSPALAGEEPAVAAGLEAEERRERDLDRAYWQPLREELERLRRER